VTIYPSVNTDRVSVIALTEIAIASEKQDR